jgi:hypothetical protein
MSTVQEADFCFVAIEIRSNRPVELTVREYDGAAKEHFQSVWQRLYGALQKHHKTCKRPPPSWTDWKPWDWCEERKTGYEGRIKYAAWNGDIPAGFLNVWDGFQSVHQSGKKVLYLEHIAAAPGNQMTEIWDSRLKAVGAALFAYAVLLSHLRGFEGRLGLHIAGDEALGFYRRLNEKCENGLFYPDRTSVHGPTPRSSHDAAKTYLETTETGAMRWLEEYRRE